jgi:hypothetical protein
MLELGWFSAKLFFKGKLLRDPMYFVQQTAIAIAIGLILLLLLAQGKVPFWLAIALTSLWTGAIMPFLLKEIKLK